MVVTAAVTDVVEVMARVRRAFKRHEVDLAAVGVDIWNDVETVPQQLRAGRYTAQAAYYRQRGHWGAVMMRHTASLQINLDLGPEGGDRGGQVVAEGTPEAVAAVKTSETGRFLERVLRDGA